MVSLRDPSWVLYFFLFILMTLPSRLTNLIILCMQMIQHFFTPMQPEINNVEQNVNNELQYISNWFKANKLILNLQKTIFCVFKNNHHGMNILQDVSLSIDSIPISKANVVIFFGVRVDINLKWDNHIEYVRSKISKCSGILHKLKLFVPQSVLFTLYNSLILPHISYCIVIWGNSSRTKIDTILRLQKRQYAFAPVVITMPIQPHYFVNWTIWLNITPLYLVSTIFSVSFLM